MFDHVVMKYRCLYFYKGRNQDIKQQSQTLIARLVMKKTELNNAKQAVNERANSDQMMKIANKAEACLLIILVLRV